MRGHKFTYLLTLPVTDIRVFSEKCETATDGTAKTRSSSRTERRVQLATSMSKTSSPSLLKHTQRSLLAGRSSSPTVSRPVRAKASDSQVTEKSGGTNDDGCVSAAAELEKPKDWIHITRHELHGLRDLVDFLESLDVAERHVPNEIQCPDELISNAKVMNQLALLLSIACYFCFVCLIFFSARTNLGKHLGTS